MTCGYMEVNQLPPALYCSEYFTRKIFNTLNIHIEIFAVTYTHENFHREIFTEYNQVARPRNNCHAK